jgi:hypothetical protein
VAGAISRVLLNFPTGSNLVSFKLRTGANQTESTDPTTIFNQTTNPWKVTASSTLAQAVTAELNVQVNNPISQIKIDSSSAVQVTPMTSTDNINWIQLPGVTTTQSVTGTTTFVFPTINPDQASNILWVKFILTKQGPDYKDTNAMYNYEFGFNSISFWYNTFQPGSTQSFYSIPLWAADSNGNPIQFSKMALQTCEQVEDSTSISYYLTTSNDPLVPVTTSTLWSPISPIQYSSPQWPTVLDINNIVTYEYPLTSGTITAPVIISYNISGVVTGNNSFKNPASGFYMITSGVLGPVVASGLATSGQRFHAGNPDNYILNYQIDQSVNIDPTSLELFRNVGQQGLVTTSGNNTVRGTQIGWGFDGQNYNCVVLITNPAGVSINFGPTPLVIDGTTVSGQVNLTGATTTTNGIHSVSISPNAWQSIPSGLTTYSGFNNSVSGLDRKLYPFNQKLLIEGYAYPSGFIGDPSIVGGQPYNTGIALFAEYYMKEVSPFDMINNIAPDGFQYFAQDSDIPASHNGAANTAQTVFVVKVDTDINDWLNEQFVLSFKLADQLVKYLRFRADMKTDTPNNTPALANYTIKLGT